MKNFKILIQTIFTLSFLFSYVYANQLDSKSVLDSILAAPTLVAPQTSSVLGFDETNLVWNSVPGAVSYNLQIAADSLKFIIVQVQVSGIKDTTFSLEQYLGSKFSAVTKYFWRVNASDGANTSPYSEIRSFILQYAYSKAVVDTLNKTYNWFMSNPPDINGSNFNSRWNQTGIIDEYGWQISNTTWDSYKSSWTDLSVSEKYEATYPILYYLHLADQHSLDDIKNAKITQGVVIWYLYNMGYVVRTKNVSFAIDLIARGSTSLADMLDFTIVSHSHADHYDKNFVSAMASKGKPVYAPFTGNGITTISSTSEFNFGEVNVRFTLNHQQTTMPVIVSQIDCGASAGNYTIYDMADARDLSALKPDRHVNILMLHIANGYDPTQAAAIINPEVTIYAHEMELGHSTAADGYRWKYSYSYNKIKSQPHESSFILMWGEKLTISMDSLPSVPVPVSPPTDTTNILRKPVFNWNGYHTYFQTKYHLQIASDSAVNTDGSFKQSNFIIDTTIDQKSFELSEPLDSNTKYYWHLKAEEPSGTSEYSVMYNFKTGTAISLPALPISNEPSIGASGVQRRPILKWNNSLYAETYEVQVATDYHIYTEGDSIGAFLSDNVVFDSTLTDTIIQLWKPLDSLTKYYWHVRALNSAGTTVYSNNPLFYFTTGTEVTDIKNKSNHIPDSFALLDNFPNPFNPVTVVKYNLPSSQFVRLNVYDILGKLVAKLVNQQKDAGYYEVYFNADLAGLTSGVYLYRIQAGKYVETKKMLLIK